MKITKFEQSGFVIEADNGCKLGFDIGRFTPLEKLSNTNLDIMLASHIHGDHFSAEHIRKISPKKLFLGEECLKSFGGFSEGKITEVKPGDKIEVDSFKITFFNVDHGPNATIVPRQNFGFLIDVDNKKVYFPGDMYYPSGLDVSKMEVDFALIPVGGFYTFGPSEALAFIKQFKKIGKVVPAHFDKTTETRDAFVKIAKNDGFDVEIMLQ